VKFSELVKKWEDGWKGRAIDEYGNEWDFLNNEIAVPEQYITKTEQRLKAFSIVNDGWELVPQPVTFMGKKKMKACKLMAEAIENPQKYEGKRYKSEGAMRDGCGNMHKVVRIDCSKLMIGSSQLYAYITSDTELEEIPQSVTFMEAEKAHGEGKTVRVEYPDFNCPEQIITEKFRKEKGGGEWHSRGVGLSFYVIRTGTWFIE
jgi:hypothetical protein